MAFVDSFFVYRAFSLDASFPPFTEVRLPFRGFGITPYLVLRADDTCAFLLLCKCDKKMCGMGEKNERKNHSFCEPNKMGKDQCVLRNSQLRL